jgi:hypothetical protein
MTNVSFLAWRYWYVVMLNLSARQRESVMPERDDWRLRNQARYLTGATLFGQQYVSGKVPDDHDHCEFCFAKFMQSGTSNLLDAGYTTADHEYWICPTCFSDFRDKFAWTVGL